MYCPKYQLLLKRCLGLCKTLNQAQRDMQKVDLKPDLQTTLIFCSSEDIFLHITLFPFFKGEVTIQEILFQSHFSHSCVPRTSFFELPCSLFISAGGSQFRICFSIIMVYILPTIFYHMCVPECLKKYRLSSYYLIILSMCKIQGGSFFLPSSQTKSTSETALWVNNREDEPGVLDQSTERQLLISH